MSEEEQMQEISEASGEESFVNIDTPSTQSSQFVFDLPEASQEATRNVVGSIREALSPMSQATEN